MNSQETHTYVDQVKACYWKDNSSDGPPPATSIVSELQDAFVEFPPEATEAQLAISPVRY